MKPKGRQSELAFTQEPYRLIADTALDGDRVQAESRQHEQDTAQSARNQWWFQQMRAAVNNAPKTLTKGNPCQNQH